MKFWDKLEPWRASGAARALFWAAAIFAFVMAVLPHPPHIPGNPNDKLQHVTAFVTLSLLGSFAYPAVPLIRLLVRLSIFGAAIEVIQAIPVLHRDSDFWDWVADTVAVGVRFLSSAGGGHAVSAEGGQVDPQRLLKARCGDRRRNGRCPSGSL